MEKLVIAIDGYSGCGKSSTAKVVAKALGLKYIDSGATYRATALYFKRENVRIQNPQEVAAALERIKIDIKFNPDANRHECWLNGENVEDRIRHMDITERVSEVSAIPAVRAAMIRIQRQMANAHGVVMDGRDIGTVVFPDADLKIFMTADLDVRAARRMKELSEKGIDANFESVKKNLAKRDRMDSERKISPLKKAGDAIEIDTSTLSFEEQTQKIVDLAKQRPICSTFKT